MPIWMASRLVCQSKQKRVHPPFIVTPVYVLYGKAISRKGIPVRLIGSCVNY